MIQGRIGCVRLRKRGKNWQADFKHDRKRCRLTICALDQEDAERQAGDLHLELTTQKRLLRERRMSMETASTIKTWWEDVDSKRVDELLARSIANNRTVAKGTVDAYAEEMAAGRWKKTVACPIVLTPDGELMNGQHTLEAVKKSGKTIPLFFSEEPKSNMIAFDSGRLRTIKHMMDVLETVPKDLRFSGPCIARTLRAKGRRMMAGAFVEFATKHEQAVRFVLERLSCCEVNGISVGGVWSAIARAWYHVDHERLSEFCEILRNGMMNNGRGAGVIILRNWLIAHSRECGGEAAKNKMLRTLRAIKGYADGQEIQRPVVGSDDLYPLPESL